MSRLRFLCAGLALIVASSPTALAAAGGPDPIAIVGAFDGKVEVLPARAKESRRAAFGLPLRKGDRVNVGRGGSATVFFSDGNVVELGEQSSVTIGARVDKPAKAEIAGEVYSQVSSFVTGGSRQTGLVALSSMRGDDSRAFLMSPRQTSLLHDRPTFVWRPVAQADRYVVRMSNESGVLWTRETRDTTLGYPEDMAALPADADAVWTVEARSPAGRLHSESSFLHVVPPEKAEEVRGRIERIDASLGARSAAAHYLAGSYLSAWGLHADAIDRFSGLCRLLPASRDAHEALGRAYAAVGLADLAAREYERALALSRSP